jgi:hypothetical protein
LMMALLNLGLFTYWSSAFTVRILYLSFISMWNGKS